jgi:hypothetical protein
MEGEGWFKEYFSALNNGIISVADADFDRIIFESAEQYEVCAEIKKAIEEYKSQLK